VYLYRAVDARGKTIDFRLSPKRDVAAAKAFFRKAFKTQGVASRTITLDGYQASHRAVRELCAERRKFRAIKVRSCQYLNNASSRITETSSLVPDPCWDSSSSGTPQPPSGESS
jgi:transposase-like protein